MTKVESCFEEVLSNMQSVLTKATNKDISLHAQGDLEGLRIIITAPSLDPTQNVSGVSSVAQFIIENNTQCEYIHFQLGKTDKETGVWNRITRIIRSYWEWKRTLSGSPCSGREIVHYSFPLSAASIIRDPLFMYYALRKRYRMVVHVHGGLFLTAPKIPFVLKKILKWVFSWDVPFIVLSEGEKKTLMERFGAKRVEVLPNCPSLPKDTTQISRKVTENLTLVLPQFSRIGTENLTLVLPQISRIGTDNSTLVMGYLGRIEPNKGMTELLEACKVLKRNGVKFKLRFAGKEQVEGEYLPRFEELNENENLNENHNENENLDENGEFFEYVGLVSGKTKDAFLRSLDVFVMPTYFEGLPVSLLECMGYGAVPVVTPVGSIPDVVRNVEVRGDRLKVRGDSVANGLFVKVKDVDSIVEAVKFLDAHRDILAHLSENARKTIMENFSAEKYVEKLNSIYRSLSIKLRKIVWNGDVSVLSGLKD